MRVLVRCLTAQASWPLTAEQRAAVDADAHALEILAGAGTGKTHTLTARVARFAHAGPAAQARLRVVTFTREATAVLARRLALVLGRDHLVQVGSFHQWAARELPSDARQFLPEAEGRRILRRAVTRHRPGAAFSWALGVPPTQMEDLVTRVGGVLSYVRNAETSVGNAVQGVFASLAPWDDLLRGVQEEYEEAKQGRLDFDDLLVAFRDRLKRSESYRQEVCGRLDHLFVDEYQDVNGVQAETVRLVTDPRKGGAQATVVGDPRQAIYGFRGGDPDHMRGFLQAYGRKGQRVRLSTSFRSSRRLVQAGNRLMPEEHPLRPRRGAPAGVEPEFAACPDRAAEARLVADRVERLLADGVDAREIAVLARSRFLHQAYADEVLSRRADEAWADKHPDLMDAAIDAALQGEEVPKKAARAALVLARRLRVAPVEGRKPTARDLLDLPRGKALTEIALSTIHGAKGLEWDHVIVVGAREGGLPSDQAINAPEHVEARMIEEERRLFYVACTRARQSLLVTWPEHDGRRPREASRFLAPFLEDAAPVVAAAGVQAQA